MKKTIRFLSLHYLERKTKNNADIPLITKYLRKYFCLPQHE